MNQARPSTHDLYLYTPRPVFLPNMPASTYWTSKGQGRYLLSPSPSCSTRMTDKAVSSPMRSASASGPIGWLVPSRIPVSMSSADATPSISA
eukprot:CAMPEP_0177786458 /NCGR_PEP_ID=MMETSP0491_2-20121128/20936_1 /TAXON_ID=63592 /ORGANISM="Tetraselmis chuii, Strain PLY429" /LENGTH=91 /DNA_ID=CAMNT_0019307675 /DNA_START=90 /DNA_END=365 /DNA_ORIENTATION=-